MVLGVLAFLGRCSVFFKGCVFGSYFALAGAFCWGIEVDQLRCGGRVEQQVWHIWDSSVKDYLLQSLVRDRLETQRDTVALYDLQTYVHNLVSMARRCRRSQQLQEIAGLIGRAYLLLEGPSLFSAGRRWICRGGLTCNDRNRLLNAEVMLHSAQFLGLATSVANALLTTTTILSEADRRFILDTARIASEHLSRWSTESAIQTAHDMTGVSSEAVKDGSTALLFTDKPLWQLGIYAELAGVLDGVADRNANLVRVAEKDAERMRRHFDALMQLFVARVSLRASISGRRSAGPVGDLDRGYWRLYDDNRYAGYEGGEKPVRCALGPDGVVRPKFVFPRETVPLVSDSGWDISHARRLVHVLDALARNQIAIDHQWRPLTSNVPVPTLAIAFASNLINNVWNGDAEYPLFANYWNGANGWYRVAWDNGTTQCREGTPPFGLSNSFPTGGYVSWATYQPLIGTLGLRLYLLFESKVPTDAAFVERYYPDFGKNANSTKAALARAMFYPSLVAVSH